MSSVLRTCGGRLRHLLPVMDPSKCPAYSTATKLTQMVINEKTRVATVSLCRPPVNGLNLELLQDINNSIQEAENHRCRGLILTSSCDNTFSAGLDIMEMYKPDQERLRKFWTTLQDTWLALYGSNIPTAAAINGHSPAGGCLLALSCEYRVMLPEYTIGLNETKLGMIAPKWFVTTMLNVLPPRTAEVALTQGKLFTTDEALRAGLIDDVANNLAGAIDKSVQFFGTFANVNPLARAMTKYQFRAAALERLQREKSEDLENFVAFVNQQSVQNGLSVYLESLKRKSKM